MDEIKAKVMMSIREKDDYFMNIQELIENKKNMLINKQRQLNNISNQNKFLNFVKDDYKRFYGHIHRQKQEQIKALGLLDEYIKDLTTSGQLTKYNIEDAKEEQRKILNEMRVIRESLDELIDDTQDINIH
jgi:hypothetical protein